MLNMALFDYAINEKCYSVYGGRGICPLFSSPPRGIWQLKSPHPREFAIQGKKNANAEGSVRGGTGDSWNWLMHYLYQAEKPSPSEPRNHQTLTWTNLSDDEPVPCKRDNWDQSILVLQKLWLETMTMKVSMPKSQKTLLIAVNFITSENENCMFLPQITLRLRSKGQWLIKLALPVVQRQLISRAFPKSDTPQNHLW